MNKYVLVQDDVWVTFHIIVMNCFSGESRVSDLGGLLASQVSKLKDSAGCLLG